MAIDASGALPDGTKQWEITAGGSGGGGPLKPAGSPADTGTRERYDQARALCREAGF